MTSIKVQYSLTTSSILRVRAVYCRYAFVILRFLIADLSRSKVDTFTSAIGESADDFLTTQDCGSNATTFVKAERKEQAGQAAYGVIALKLLWPSERRFDHLATFKEPLVRFDIG